MLRAVNRGSSESFGNLERQWRDQLSGEKPPKIEVAIEKTFEGDSKVSIGYVVTYRVADGKWIEKEFDNVG